MRSRMIGLVSLGLFFLAFTPVCHAQQAGYFEQMGKTFVRGLKNIVSFPVEIPATIREHDQRTDGNPRVFRNIAGFFDGTFRSVARLGCGAWDVVWCAIPGNQEGLPLKPETFF